MNQVIFKNPKSLSKKDIFLAISIGLGTLILAELLLYVRGNQRVLFRPGSFIFGGILILIWIIKAVRETTIKSIEIHDSKIIFIIQSQFNKNKIVAFEKDSISIEIITKPDRFIPRNKIMTITSGEYNLMISSRQKGLSAEILLDIQEKLKHSSQQPVIRNCRAEGLLK